MSTMTRKSSRLLGKTAVAYQEKKIPVISKSRVSKKSVVAHEKIQSGDTKKEKIKIERIKVKTAEYSNEPSVSHDLSKQENLESAIKHFKSCDPKLASYLDDEDTMNRLKARLTRTSRHPFGSLASAIIYQQIHGKAAASIEARFIKLFDDPSASRDDGWYPSPSDVLDKSIEELRSAGLSARKVEYIRDLAEKFNDKTITPENFKDMTDQEISEQLIAVKGIGQWTVDMFLMNDLYHSDILPLGDLGVRKGVAQHFGLPTPSDKKKVFPLPHHMIELTDMWRPYRSLGSWLMWRILDIKVTGDPS